MAESNRQSVLKSRPQGMVVGGNVEWREEPKPEIRDDELLVRNGSPHHEHQDGDRHRGILGHRRMRRDRT